MSSVFSRPLPRLPLETQAAILRFCDVPTLGVSSRVSLAWLELAGPILYEHITIRGKDQLELMVRSDSDTVLASIAPFVSLDQTRTFTHVTLEEEDVSKSLAASSVRLEQLIVDLRELVLYTPAFDLSVFLYSFDPRHFHVLSELIAEDRFGSLLDMAFDPVWPELRQVTFTHSRVSQAELVGLADRSLPLDLVYDISGRFSHLDDLEFTLDKLVADLCSPTDQPIFGCIQVWLHDDAEVAFAKEKLVGCSCTSLNIAVKPH